MRPKSERLFYKMKYDMSFGQFTKKQLEAENNGGCDQVLLCSILDNPDGSSSYMWVQANGHTKEARIDPLAVFNAWIILADALSTMPELKGLRATLAGDVFQIYKEALTTQVPGDDDGQRH